MMSYPLFIPPENFFGTKNFEWSLKEAKEYFNWFLSIKEERLENYIKFLSIERNDIAVLGDKMFELLFDPEFSSIRKDQRRDLTNAGYALAADASLFISDYIVRKYEGKIYWDIVKKPKSAVSYHLPALFGFVKLPYVECMGGGIANARSILWGESNRHIWREMAELDDLFV